MSIDFGLFQGITIGDIVWHDLNNDGLRTGGELGIAGLNVDLMNPGADGQVGGSAANADTIVASTVTNASGVYGFTVFSPGSYFVRVEAPVATPVVSSYRVTSDNGVNNDNNGVQPGGLGTPAYGPIVSLLEGQEPGTDGATNFETTIDFGFRACPAIAISPSSMPEAVAGVPYTGALSADGGKAPYVWSLVSGNLPPGLGMSPTGEISGDPTTAGTYTFHVRATDESLCSGTRRDHPFGACRVGGQSGVA
jgi:hypothetical protein